MAEATKQDIYDIKEEIGILKEKFDQVLIALIGSEITKDGGLVERINFNEKQLLELEKRVRAVEARNDKTELLIKIIWGCGGALIMALIGFVTKAIHF